MFHTSPLEIKQGSIKKSGIAGDCLFFSDEIYKMACGDVFVYSADFNTIEASELYDTEIIEDIAAYFGIEADQAESLLDGSESEWNMDGCQAEDSWWIQGKRGECAAKMGYDGCQDEDEQGVVYIIPMTGREQELKIVA